ncbi:hypothetical protein D3C85_1101120 [compost metagenome]
MIHGLHECRANTATGIYRRDEVAAGVLDRTEAGIPQAWVKCQLSIFTGVHAPKRGVCCDDVRDRIGNYRRELERISRAQSE